VVGDSGKIRDIDGQYLGHARFGGQPIQGCTSSIHLSISKRCGISSKYEASTIQGQVVMSRSPPTDSSLLNHETLTLQDADVVTTALEQFRRRPALGFSDCLVLETARKAGHLPLGTFDRDLAKLDGAMRLQ
jgi:predicted nucleic acid-binding protein